MVLQKEDYEKYEIIKEEHNNEENALIVEDYPYGFHARTKIKYWLEKTKNGYRFVSQTLNPKTNEWNKPKKSTYCELGFMVRIKENGFISWVGFGITYADEKEFNDFMEFIKDVKLTEQQEKLIKQYRAILKTREHLTFTVRTRKFKHKTTGEIISTVPIFEMSNYEEVDDNGNLINTEEEKKKDEENSKTLRKVYSYYARKEGL